MLRQLTARGQFQLQRCLTSTVQSIRYNIPIVSFHTSTQIDLAFTRIEPLALHATMSSDYKADFDTLIQKMRDNPDKDYINSYGVRPDEKELLIRESALLKPYRLYVFKAVVELLNDLEVKWFIADGTLLGWYRHGAMIAHDYDLDVAIMEEDLQIIWKNRHKLPSGVVLDNIGSADKTGCVWVTDDTSIPYDPALKSSKKLSAYNTMLPPKPKDGPVFVWEACIDIQTYRRESDGWHNNYNMHGLDFGAITFPDDVIFPVVKAKFEGMEIYIPNNAERWLELNYGYLGEDAVWDAGTQKYKRRQGQHIKI